MDMFHDCEQDEHAKAISWIVAALIAIFLAGFASCANAYCKPEVTQGWIVVPEAREALTIYYDEQKYKYRTLAGKEYRKFDCDGKWRMRDERKGVAV